MKKCFQKLTTKFCSCFKVGSNYKSLKDSKLNDDEYHFGFNGNIYVSQSIGLTDKDYRLLNYPTITLITLHKESD